MNALFCYLGVFAQNVCFIKKVPSLLREDFFDLSKHPQQTFWTFFAYSTNICFQNLYFLDKWGVEGVICKHFEPLAHYPQRNNMSKLATFDPIFQLPHSAMIAPSFRGLHLQLHLEKKYSKKKKSLREAGSH